MRLKKTFLKFFMLCENYKCCSLFTLTLIWPGIMWKLVPPSNSSPQMTYKTCIIRHPCYIFIRWPNMTWHWPLLSMSPYLYDTLWWPPLSPKKETPFLCARSSIDTAFSPRPMTSMQNIIVILCGLVPFLASKSWCHPLIGSKNPTCPRGLGWAHMADLIEQINIFQIISLGAGWPSGLGSWSLSLRAAGCGFDSRRHPVTRPSSPPGLRWPT